MMMLKKIGTINFESIDLGNRDFYSNNYIIVSKNLKTGYFNIAKKLCLCPGDLQSVKFVNNKEVYDNIIIGLQRFNDCYIPKPNKDNFVTIEDENGRTSTLQILEDGKIRVIGVLPHNTIFRVTKGKEKLIDCLQRN